jgi:type I restriction enzyme, S subunit
MTRKEVQKYQENDTTSFALVSLPPGWSWSKVAQVGEIKLGRQRSPEHHQGTHMRPYLRVANVYEDRLDLSSVLEMNFTPSEFEQYQLRYGDILLNEGQSLEWVGRPAMYRDELPGSCFQNTLIRFRPHECVNGKFALLVFRYFVHSRRFQKIARWTVNIAHLGASRLAEVEFPVPPLREQERIVARAEELFSDLDAGVTALKRAKANLKRYRAAVLRAAVEGKLTEAWRAEHPQSEPASKLLARILTERRKKWEADQLAKFDAAKKEPPKNWREKYVEPSPLEMTGLPELPETWCWPAIQQVGAVQLGRQRSPKNHNGPHMRPYLRVANVFEDRIDLGDVMEMNFTPKEFETFRLSYGDILLNEGQSMELVGRPAMYRDEVPGACFTNSLVRFQVYDGVDTNYALKVFLAYLKNGRFMRIATITVNIAHLGAGRFSEVEFPLPPLEEQHAIVEEVDRHFSLIDAADRAISLGLARAARLRQSILKDAFEGKLVPQDPNDEPARVLLDRLRASQSAHEANGKKATPTRACGRRVIQQRMEGFDDE